MTGWWAQAFAEIERADRIVGVRPIARRYFAMNAFDGVVTTIGVVMGNMVAGIADGRIVLATGFVAAIAMSISGFWGAYLTEAAERRRSLDDLQNHTLTDLSHSSVARAGRIAVVVVTVVDGLSPFLGAAIVLIPFVVSQLIAATTPPYIPSLVTAVVALFGLGAYLGRVSGGGVWAYGLKTSLAGLMAIGIGYLLRVANVSSL